MVSLEGQKPDFVIVILGGNDLKADSKLPDIYKESETFFRLLKERVPKATVIAAQIENRFYKPNNRFESPVGEKFDYLRRYYNRFLKRKKFKDFLLQVQGPSLLDNKEFYKDCVHLNERGLRKYLQLIKKTLLYIVEKSK